jgi:prepilin-type N-terminal cleavage/methylation domain-containing protein
MSATRPNPGVHRGFTLVELAVVVALSGILAAGVVPAWERVRSAQRIAARAELVRVLCHAREQALARGQAVGVSIDAAVQEIGLVWMAPGSDEATAMPDALGQPVPMRAITRALGDCVVTGLELSGVPGSAGVVWFGHDGTPELRSDDGGLLGDATAASRVALEGVDDVVIAPLSGMVE